MEKSKKVVLRDAVRRKGQKTFTIAPVLIEAVSAKQEKMISANIQGRGSSLTTGMSQCVRLVEQDACLAIIVARTEAKPFVDFWVNLAHLHGVIVCFLPTVDSEKLARLVGSRARRCSVVCLGRSVAGVPTLAPLVLCVGAMSAPTTSVMRPRGRLQLLRAVKKKRKTMKRRKKLNCDNSPQKSASRVVRKKRRKREKNVPIKD